MKQTVTINGPQDLKQFKRDFSEIIDVVRQANGKYVLYVHKRSNPVTHSMFVTKGSNAGGGRIAS